ncbi:MAG TPA: MGMT family protein [Spirochaetota bacterium]
MKIAHDTDRGFLRHDLSVGKLSVVVIANDEYLDHVFIDPDRTILRGLDRIPRGINAPIRRAITFFEAYARRKDATRPPLDLSGFTENEKRVYEHVSETTFGDKPTYGELALRSGFPRAARFVGSCMRKNRYPIIIPCHRVVPSAGGVGKYSPSSDIKKYLLDFESGSDM